MKKIVLIGVLLTSSLGFSRIINSCEITGKGITNNGVRYINCTSTETGKKFNFINMNKILYENVLKKDRYKIYFSGQGYDKLRIDDVEYIGIPCDCM